MPSMSQYPWYPGDAATGVKVNDLPVINAGYVQKQAGERSFPPSITQPGTVASGGTVLNSTGLDCNVYMTAVSGIGNGGIKILTYNGPNVTTYSPFPSGSITVGAQVMVQVPGPGAIAVTYGGSLVWTWIPA